MRLNTPRRIEKGNEREREELRNAPRCNGGDGDGGDGGERLLALRSSSCRSRWPRERRARIVAAAAGTGARQRRAGDHGSVEVTTGEIKEKIESAKQTSDPRFFEGLEAKRKKWPSSHFFARKKKNEREPFLALAFCLSGSRGVPGTSTSPGSDEGGQQQAPAPVLDATIKSRVSGSRRNAFRTDQKRLLFTSRRLRESSIDLLEASLCETSNLPSHFFFLTNLHIPKPQISSSPTANATGVRVAICSGRGEGELTA